jgi:hypothetical protein
MIRRFGVFALLSCSHLMAQLNWNSKVGFDFRGTAGYVTDPGNTVFVGGSQGGSAAAYPTVSGSVTYGYLGNSTNGAIGINRNGSIDARLSGINYANPGASNPMIFEVDLPAAGTCTVELAAGDAAQANSSQTVKLADNGAVFQTVLSSATVNAGSFADAHGLIWTAAQWPGSNTALTHTFITNKFQLIYGDTAGYTVVSHLGITCAPIKKSSPRMIMQ